jgi:hypothetical protein
MIKTLRSSSPTSRLCKSRDLYLLPEQKSILGRSYPGMLKPLQRLLHLFIQVVHEAGVGGGQ